MLRSRDIDPPQNLQLVCRGGDTAHALRSSKKLKFMIAFLCVPLKSPKSLSSCPLCTLQTKTSLPSILHPRESSFAQAHFDFCFVSLPTGIMSGTKLTWREISHLNSNQSRLNPCKHHPKEDIQFPVSLQWRTHYSDYDPDPRRSSVFYQGSQVFSFTFCLFDISWTRGDADWIGKLRHVGVWPLFNVRYSGPCSSRRQLGRSSRRYNNTILDKWEVS